MKLKNLYINILKTLSQMINNDYESITYNMKFYSDYLHKNIIKLFCTDSNKLSIMLFKSLMTTNLYEKFRNIVYNNMMLIDIITKLTWNNLPKKLNYLSLFYKNDNIIHYMDKLNKNIIPENLDHRIKKIIENPYEMYKYLRKEKDFIRWTKFLANSNKITQLYVTPISLSTEDFNLIGRMIFLLFSIEEQNLKDLSYKNFIDFCTTNSKLILDSSRINFKIKEYFTNLKSNINLGFLAKHLTSYNDVVTLTNSKINLNKSFASNNDIIELEKKLEKTTRKYIKYKIKYMRYKNIDMTISSSKLPMSDTSSNK